MPPPPSGRHNRERANIYLENLHARKRSPDRASPRVGPIRGIGLAPRFYLPIAGPQI